MHSSACRWLLVAGIGLPLAAQIGYPPVGGYPGQYPPGNYPPGTGYPPGGQYPRDPTTGRYPTGRYPGDPTNGRRSPKQDRNKKDAPATTATLGVLRRVEDKALVVEADDHRLVRFQTSDQTKFVRAGKPVDPGRWRPGDRLQVNATADERANLYAVTVTFEREGTEAERAKASAAVDVSAPAATDDAPSVAGDEDRPVIRRKDQPATAERGAPGGTTVPPPDVPADPDDTGPPRLRRGAPSPRPSRASLSGGESGESGGPMVAREAAPEPVNPESSDPFLQKAREAAQAFTETLPNFACRQVVSRSVNDGPRTDWRVVDVITTDVAYENGTERYRRLLVNGRPSKKAVNETGAWSRGEFNGVVRELFSPLSGATFHRRGQETIGRQEAAVYDFRVARERSNWRIYTPSQSYLPAYKGTVWLDRETGRVLRVEAQAVGLPEAFPFDATETATDYDLIRLGTSKQFLVPVHAEVLTCTRNGGICSKNTLDYRNYRKFDTESEVDFSGQ